jgi:hypothetical protein
MDKKTLAVANIIALLATIIINYLSNTGIFNESTMASVSEKYENLFTPAGYAFSIWGLIYLGLIGFIVYQSKVFFKNEPMDDEEVYEEEETVYQIGWLFAASCVVNCLWVLAWLYDYTGISVLLMIALLYFLFRIILNTRMELQDASFKKIALVWWPFSIYSGWITVALIANIAAYLTKLGWEGFTSEITWTIIMICIAGAINLVMTWTRNMREYAVAGAWGLIAIAVANWDGVQGIVQTALAVSILVLISSGLHAYKNRKRIIVE